MNLWLHVHMYVPCTVSDSYYILKLILPKVYIELNTVTFAPMQSEGEGGNSVVTGLSHKRSNSLSSADHISQVILYMDSNM